MAVSSQSVHRTRGPRCTLSWIVDSCPGLRPGQLSLSWPSARTVVHYPNCPGLRPGQLFSIPPVLAFGQDSCPLSHLSRPSAGTAVAVHYPTYPGLRPGQLSLSWPSARTVVHYPNCPSLRPGQLSTIPFNPAKSVHRCQWSNVSGAMSVERCQ